MTEPHDGTPRTHQLLDAISECVPAIGTEAFTERFLQVALEAQAVQVTAFAYQTDKVDCLLSRNFLSETKGGALAAAYLDGWFRDDPVFEQIMAMDEDRCVIERLADLIPGINSRYLTKFFGAPGFRTKIAVLVSQGGFRIALNLYFEREINDRPVEALNASVYRLIGKMVATHFLRLSPLEFPLPLTVLSDRERQVCIGMLEGKKAEVIAGDIGVAASSVVTYRQRAYQKLGISSRGQLFSICRPVDPLRYRE